MHSHLVMLSLQDRAIASGGATARMQVRWGSLRRVVASHLHAGTLQPRLSQCCAQHHLRTSSRTACSTSSSDTASAVIHDVEQKPPSTTKLPGYLQSNYCRMCGSPMTIKVPEGDSSQRHVCSGCGYVDYFNPKMVVGAVVEHQGKVLLCRRAIEPCKGLWTLPAGYMELSESSADGAARETWEEANAKVKIIAPYAHYDIPVIGQAYIIFRAVLEAPYSFSPGPETLETQLFAPDEIPYDSIAFSSIAITLRMWVDDKARGNWRVHHGVIDKVPGSSPNDPGTFKLRDHFAMQTQA